MPARAVNSPDSVSLIHRDCFALLAMTACFEEQRERHAKDRGPLTGPLRISAQVEGADAALAVAAALDGLAGAVAAFEIEEAERGRVALWRVEAYPRTPLMDSGLEVRLALAAAAAGGRLLQVFEERLPERDWLAENRRAFPPLRIGRFLVHGSHWPGPPKGAAHAGAIAIEIDAATAFGTGEHPSTHGCLLALDSLARRRRFERPLDIGTGSGILAIAAAKRLRRVVLASDVDCAAVRVAVHHVRRNGLAGRVRVVCAPGYRSRALRRTDYDLIFANILARPLALMARDLGRAIAPGGVAVLAGLLRRQEAQVLAAHRAQGLALKRRLVIEGWSTLIMCSGDQR
jgi:ribosomal protein L11 methyltransferase